MGSHYFSDKLIREILLAACVVEIVGERFVPIARKWPEEIFRKREVPARLVSIQPVYLDEPLQEPDGGIYTIAILIVIQSTVEVGPFRNKHRPEAPLINDLDRAFDQGENENIGIIKQEGVNTRRG